MSIPNLNFKKTCFISSAICSIEPYIKHPVRWSQNPVFYVKQLESLWNRDMKEGIKHKEEGKGRVKSDMEDEILKSLYNIT